MNYAARLALLAIRLHAIANGANLTNIQRGHDHPVPNQITNMRVVVHDLTSLACRAQQMFRADEAGQTPTRPCLKRSLMLSPSPLSTYRRGWCKSGQPVLCKQEARVPALRGTFELAVTESWWRISTWTAPQVDLQYV